MVFELPTQAKPPLDPSLTSPAPLPLPVNPIFIQIDHDPNQRQPHLTYAPQEGSRMIKNVSYLSGAIMLILTAYRNMTAIGRSEYYYDNDIFSFVLTLGIIVVSAFFMPVLLIRKLTTKTVIMIAMVGYCLHVVLQFVPVSSTFLVSQFIISIFSVPLLVAAWTYLSHTGHEHARLTKVEPQVSMTKFFSIFYFFFQICGILGPMLTTLVDDKRKSYDYNEDYDNSNYSGWNHDGPRSCGINRGNMDLYENYNGDNYFISFRNNVSTSKIWGLAIFCVVTAIASVVIVYFLVDPLVKYGERMRKMKSNCELFFATFIHLKNVKQWLLIPLTLWLSFNREFFTGTFMRRYVSCAWNETFSAQYVYICYGVAAALSSITISQLIRQCFSNGRGRPLAIILASSINLSLMIILCVWEPRIGQSQSKLFAIAFFWGIADGIWMVELGALYGNLFHNKIVEAGFTNYELWTTVGSILFVGVFIETSGFFPIYFLMISLALGLIGYGVIEKMESRRIDQ